MRRKESRGVTGPAVAKSDAEMASSAVATPLRLSAVLTLLAGGLGLYLAAQLRNPLFLAIRPTLRSLTLGGPLIVLTLLFRQVVQRRAAT